MINILDQTAPSSTLIIVGIVWSSAAH